MKNRLSDLNNHLLAQLEQPGDGDLSQEQIDQEAKRVAIVAVSEQVRAQRRSVAQDHEACR